MHYSKVPYPKKNSYRVLYFYILCQKNKFKKCIGHKKIAFESGYTSSAEQLISFNELGHMPSKKKML